jgi:hypothetical protein
MTYREEKKKEKSSIYLALVLLWIVEMKFIIGWGASL